MKSRPGPHFRRALGVLALAGGALPACKVTALAERESAIAVNECESNDQCAGGSCRGGLCVATTTELSSLLFEITLASNAGSLAGASFLERSFRFSAAGGSIDLELDARAVSGSVTPVGRRDCGAVFRGPRGELLGPARDGSIPARVTFTPTALTDGLALPGRISEVDTQPNLGSAPNAHAFKLELAGGTYPLGRYDAYVDPYPLEQELGPGCVYPPQLIRGLCVDGASLPLRLPAPAHLELSIAGGERRFDGWVADVLDPSSGRPLSRPVVLQPAAEGSDEARYSATLDYVPVLEYPRCDESSTSSKSEMVRLAPPTGVVAPVLLFERAALTLFSADQARIEDVPTLPAPVVVEGHVFSGTADAEPATLTLVAEALAGVPSGVMATFTRQVETTEQGRFEVELLPGKYRVHVAPESASADDEFALAASTVQWEVASTPPRQGGRGIELRQAAALQGRAVTPGAVRAGARGASVVAEPSTTASADNVLARSQAGVFIGPRATTTVINDESGGFRLSAELGDFDISVRPPEGSGFAWFVMPNLRLSVAGEVRELGRLELPLPYVVDVWARISGVGGERLAGARVRAHAVLDANGQPAASGAEASLIPVAEGRLDGNGHVRLLVPASLHQVTME